MKHLILGLGAALILSACGSSVKLNDTPVEDRNPAQSSGSGSTAPAPASSQASQAPVAEPGLSAEELRRRELDALVKSYGQIVYFDFDSFAIRPEFQAALEAHAKFLKANKSVKVNLEGHTDERGGREYNLALGQKRSEAVKRALVVLGVSESQLEAVSFGKEKPADMGNNEAAFAKNRRVELSYR